MSQSMASISSKRRARFSTGVGSLRWTTQTAKKNHASFASVAANEVAFSPFDSPVGAIAFGSSALDTGGKVKNFMKRRTIKYTEDKGEIAGELRGIADELPSLEELAGKTGKQTKVTLALDDDALAFFKREASRRRTSYQRMIRNLVRSYARAQASR